MQDARYTDALLPFDETIAACGDFRAPDKNMASREGCHGCIIE